MVDSGRKELFVRYHKSIILLVVIALNFYIRIPGSHISTTPHLFNNGLAIAWLIWPLVIFGGASNLQRWAGGVFYALMYYCLIDNLFSDLKTWTNFDLYSIISILLAGLITGIIVLWYGTPINKRELVSVVILFVMAWFIIAGRNYVENYPYLFSLLGWEFNYDGDAFFEADAFAGILSSAYIIYNTTGLNRRIGIVHLLFTLHNYYDEKSFDPVHTTISEWVVVVVIVLFGVILLRKEIKNLLD